ncbi:hypothetical protein Tco_0816988 [Tanacetum coccineum]
MQDSTDYKTYLAFATGAKTLKKVRKFKKPTFPSKKKTLVAVEEPAEKPVNKPATRRQSAGGSSKGAGLEPEVLDEEKGKSSDTSEETGLKSRVLDVSKAVSFESEYESWGVVDLNKTGDEEEDEFVHTPDDYVSTDNENVEDEEFERINKEMYSDVNVEMKDTKLEGEGKDDEEMTDAGYVDDVRENVNQDVASAQVKDVARTTITAAPATQNTEVPLQKATTSTTAVPDSSTLTIIHQRLSDVENEVKTLKNVDHISAIRTAVVIGDITAELDKEHSVLADVIDVLQQQPKPQKSVIDILKIKMEQAGKQQYPNYTIISSDDEDAMDKGVADKLKKRKPDDTDRDEGPPARPDQGLKRKKTCKEIEPSKKAKSTGTSKGTTKSQPKAIKDTGNTDEPLVVKADPKDWFKKPKRPPTSDPKWNEGKTIDNKPTQKWLSDLAKAETSSKKFDDLTSTLIDFSAFVMNRLQISDLTQDILIVPVDYFFNNDLACLQGGSTDRTYTTSLTKKKAAKYDLPRIEDMGPKRQRFYRYASKRLSKHDVYSTKRILAVTNVKVNVWYVYGHLEEIEVQRSDQQLYKFMEGDFLRLHLKDIKDMLLLVVQNRLFNLKGEDVVHLADALHMFTRRIVIQKRLEDLQFGVESYQKKLNSSKPRTREENLSRRAPYTTLLDPQGVIYEDKLNRKRLMRSDELNKFSDGTLQSVCDTLHDMATNLRMGYNKAMPKRRWSHLDKTRSCIVVKEIDHQLRERRLMRSLEKFVGGRHYGEDLRLLQRTI